MAITVNTKTPIAITVSSVGSGNSLYTKERNPHRGGGGGHLAPAPTGKFLSNEKRLEIENERLREALKQIEYLDRPQNRGLPRRVSIHEIALAALKEGE
jgi:hypothetical protein